MQPYFKTGAFKPTESFQSVLDTVESEGFNAPATAAGILAGFTDGENFDELIQCLKMDGLTQAGLLALAQAALRGIEEENS